MNRYKIKYNHTVYKPSHYDTFKSQESWELKIEAESEAHVKELLINEHKLNPFYFTIEKIN